MIGLCHTFLYEFDKKNLYIKRMERIRDLSEIIFLREAPSGYNFQLRFKNKYKVSTQVKVRQNNQRENATVKNQYIDSYHMENIFYTITMDEDQVQTFIALFWNMKQINNIIRYDFRIRILNIRAESKAFGQNEYSDTEHC